MLALIVVATTLLTGCNVSVNTAPQTEEQAFTRMRTEDKFGYGLSMIEDRTYGIEKKRVPLYLASTDEEDTTEIDLVFMDGEGQVPYITTACAGGLLNMLMVKFYSEYDPREYALTITEDGNKVTLTRPTHYYAEFDFDENTIYFLDYDGFIRLSDNVPLLDTISCTGFTDEGEPFLFQASESSFERYGDPVLFRPGDYGIDLIEQDGEYFIPLQLFSDIFLSPYRMNTLFNEQAVFVLGGGNFADIADVYLDVDAPEERSDALIEYNYKELCFALDALYGLKDQHRIENFDTLFKETGLVEPLLSKDPMQAGQALADLTLKFFDDGHSAFANTRSYMMKEEPKINLGPSFAQKGRDYKRFAEARTKSYPDGVPGYEEVGNTAFITFDQFVYQNKDYYDEPAENTTEDTVELMIYSYQQITRQDSPVKNVVLDLTNNGGGMTDAAAFVIGTFIGEGSICMMNPMSGALCCENFKVDVNLDRQFDDKDNLLDYHLFCLISPNSFSCGNLVPSALKNSHVVTILGQASGGGACVVQYLTTADGCSFQTSGIKQLSYTKNGAFYDIDQGVEPDYMITNPDLMYDREHMNAYINRLMGEQYSK